MISGVRASSIRIEFDLVDDGVMERPMHHILQPKLHVIAQIIEAQLVIGAVGDIGGVGLAALGIGKTMHNAAYRQPEEAVDRAHPLGVATRQVVVNGDHVHALPRQCVEIDRQGRDQRLALAGLHLGDHAPVQDDTAEQLHVEGPLTQCSFRRLTHGGEGVDQEIVERLASRQPLAEPGRAGAQLIVAECLELWLECIDGGDVLIQAFEESFVGAAEEPPRDRSEHP